MASSDTTTGSGGKSHRWLLAMLGFGLVAVCLACCGGPIALYFAVTESSASRSLAPATPEPLSARELLAWFDENRPAQPLVWHDKTRDDVEFRGVIQQFNVGSELRIEGRRRLADLEPQRQTRYADWGQAQLVYFGETQDQVITCWFQTTTLTAGLSVGQEVVVRGRIGELSYADGRDPAGSYEMNLLRCRVVSD